MKITFTSNKWMLLLLCCGMSMVAMAQRNISGNVNDADNGEPLVGATILAVGTNVGTVCDLDGNFSLTVPNTAKEINISYTGYNAQTIVLTDANTYKIALQSGQIFTDVVVIGYGTTKKKDLTGAVTAISSKEFQKGNIVTPEQLIAGKAAGVQITSNSGAPGSGSRIRIRGGSSLNANNDPLIVIDGVPLSSGGTAGAANPLSFLNPDDIENISILKDASATAIYGSRASNGVIIVTTKTGKSGRLKVNFSSTTSMAEKTGIIDVLSAQDFRDSINSRGTANQKNLLGEANTVWQEEIYRTAISSDNNLGFSGSVKNLPYRVSLGYLNQNGILLKSNMNRFSGSVNLTPTFFDDHLRVSVGVRTSLSKSHFSDEGAIGSAVRFDPTQSVKSDTTTYNGYFEWLQTNGKPEVLAPRNPVALLDLKQDKSNVWRTLSFATIDYRFHFLPGLRANLNVALDQTNGSGSVFFPETAAAVFTRGGTDNVYEQHNSNKLLEYYMNYEKEFKSIGSKFDIMGGYSYQDFIREDSSIDRSINPVTIYNENYYKTQNTLVSFFGRTNFNIKERYLLTATIRRDGSSRFSPAARWGWFPSAALSWRINEEGFLRNVKAITNLKLRLGWGTTGQQDVLGDYPYLPRYTLSEPTAQYPLGDTYYYTYRPEGYDENIRWESTTTYNAALDFGILADRLTGSIDFYIKDTKDLLSVIPVPAGSNLTNQILTNVGNIRNQGVEVSLNIVPVRTENLSVNWGINATFNNNKITNLTRVKDENYLGIAVGGISGGVGNTIQIHSVDYPTNSFFVYEQKYDEAGNPLENEYVDRNNDGAVTPEDRYRFKSPNAPIFLGTSLGVEYKNWSASTVLRANIGNYVYNNVYSGAGAWNNIANGNKYLANLSSNVLETTFKNNQYFSDYYISDASFLRMDNVSVGYTFRNIFRNASSLRIAGLVQNVFVATKYKGLDPEVVGGIDNNFYPRPRTYSLSLNVDF